MKRNIHFIIPLLLITGYNIRLIWIDNNVFPWFITMFAIITVLIIGLLIKQLYK